MECRYQSADAPVEGIQLNTCSTNFFYTNIRSIHKNYDSLIHTLNALNTEIKYIHLTETWSSETKKSPLLENYSLFETVRFNKEGGGVAIYVRKDCQVNEIFDIKYVTDDIESVFIKDIENNVIGTIYRPPQGNLTSFMNKIKDIFDYLTARNLKIYINGDFNLDLLKQNVASIEFKMVISSYDCQICTTLPTRITMHSATLLDLFITSESNVKHFILQTDISDHYALFSQYISGAPILQQDLEYSYRKLSKQNLEKFKNQINLCQWNDVLEESDVNKAYNKFLEKIILTLDKTCSTVNLKKSSVFKKKLPWINNDLKDLIKIKNTKYKIFAKTRTELNWNNYKQSRNNVVHALRKAKISYYYNEFAQNDSKKTWINLNILLNRENKNTKIDGIKKGDVLLHEPREMANCINDFFISVGSPATQGQPCSSTKRPEDYFKKTELNTFYFSPVTEQEVQREIENLPVKNSTDIDGLNSKIIKHIAINIIKPLTYIINKSIETTTVPDSMKVAKVTPIYKKGDPTLAGNYRPISILPIFSKILEKLVNRQILMFLDKYKLIYKKQFGFLSKSNTELAIADLLDGIYKSKDERDDILAIFVDIQKAFDSLDHQILISKLNQFGLRGNIRNWLVSYLRNRFQTVKLNNTYSTKQEIRSGVPQGSVLGPTLFLLFINDMQYVSTKSEPYLFADDTSLVWSNSKQNLIDLVIEDFKLYLEWFEVNKLGVNASKTEYIVWK